MENTAFNTRKSFWVIVLFFAIEAVAVCFGIYKGLGWVLSMFSENIGQDMIRKNLEEVIRWTGMLSQDFYTKVIPAVGGTFLLLAVLLWIIHRILLLKDNGKSRHPEDGEKGSASKRKKDFVDQKIEMDKKRRLFLHTLSVLQRDGRLLDFLDEDLSRYEDDQIGAAVRSIQEDCKKSVKKYLNLKPVIETEEGEPVTIEAGFDIDAVKLVGNVAGDPPFEGIVKHRGWKAGKNELPKLAAVQDASIISPAEVEVQ